MPSNGSTRVGGILAASAGEVRVLRCWLGPGGDGREKSENQNKGPGGL